MVLPLPLQWYFALATRGLESVLSSGIGGDGFAILGPTAVPFVLGFPPLVSLSLLYGFLFWRHRERGIALTARLRVPLYGAGLLAVMLAVMVLVALSRGRRELRTSLGAHSTSSRMASLHAYRARVCRGIPAGSTLHPPCPGEPARQESVGNAPAPRSFRLQQTWRSRPLAPGS